jgi:hypothetical protein
VAVVAIPVVLATQYRGGAAPQWAGRYLLTSGLLLTVAGLAASTARLRIAVTVLAAATTAFGLAWLATRSHDVERTIAAVERRPEPVIVSTVGHLAREGGATYGDRRWLTAVGEDATREAAGVVAAAGEDELVLVQVATDDPLGPAALPGWDTTGRPTTLRLFDGVDLRLTPYRR